MSKWVDLRSHLGKWSLALTAHVPAYMLQAKQQRRGGRPRSLLSTRGRSSPPIATRGERPYTRAIIELLHQDRWIRERDC